MGAEARSRFWIAELRAAGCPPTYEVLRQASHSAREVAAARRGRFKLDAGDFPRVTVRPPADWNRDPFHSIVWRNAYHRLTYLDRLFYAYSQAASAPRERRAALAQARDIVLDWIERNPRGSDRTDTRAWTDKVVGDRAPYLAYAGRAAACEGLLRGAEAKAIVHSLERHARYLADDEHYNPSNHGLFVDLGLGLVAEYLSGHRSASRWLELARSRFIRTLRGRLNASEGVWLEHSVGYQTLAVVTAKRFLDLVAGDDQELRDLIGRMLDVEGWFVMPDGRIAQFGDTDLREARREAELAAADDDGLMVYPESGYAIVKDRATGSYLAVTAGFHSYRGKRVGISHKQADDLGFELFERGRRIVSDTGQYDKEDSPFREFARSSQAHSVLTVDGDSFPLRNSTTYGSGIRAYGAGAGWHAILAENPLLEDQGVVHERLFLYRPNHALVVVDDVRANERHRYDRHFQLGPSLDAYQREGHVRLTAPGFRATLSDDGSHGRSQRSLAHGERKPVQGFTFPEFRRKRARYTVIYRSSGFDRLHVATFGLDPNQPVHAAAPAGGDGTTLILTSPGKAPVELRIAREGTRLTVSEE